ncbi:hypothetical protein AAG906_041229 [Vitis piasezkii]
MSTKKKKNKAKLNEKSNLDEDIVNFPIILNWTGTATPKYIEIQSLFVETNLSLHSILIPTLEKREQEYVKCFEFEAQSDDALQDNVNNWEKNEDHEKVEAYTIVAAAVMKGGKEGYSSKLPSFKVEKSSNEPYNATMGNETTLDFKSKLEKIETLRRDNDKEALKDDPLDATVVHVFPHQLSPNIFKIPYAQPSNGYTNKRANGLVS